MQRDEILSYEPLLKQHEAKIQERRQERKAETQRLDGLKKTLEAKLRLVSALSHDVRVA